MAGFFVPGRAQIPGSASKGIFLRKSLSLPYSILVFDFSISENIW